MSLLETVSVQCPHCWERIELVVDCSIDQQTLTEDCFVCCRPIVFHIHLDETGFPIVSACREEDA